MAAETQGPSQAEPLPAIRALIAAQEAHDYAVVALKECRFRLEGATKRFESALATEAATAATLAAAIAAFKAEPSAPPSSEPVWTCLVKSCVQPREALRFRVSTLEVICPQHGAFGTGAPAAAPPKPGPVQVGDGDEP